ncbi:MAG: carboxypeptidase regulatory-like domain-containing protein [Myxococcales bacterium]|nr:carboxypeptidase regulatory-like domain-containing protein [Myxococcales bacterium]
MTRFVEIQSWRAQAEVDSLARVAHPLKMSTGLGVRRAGSQCSSLLALVAALALLGCGEDTAGAEGSSGAGGAGGAAGGSGGAVGGSGGRGGCALTGAEPAAARCVSSVRGSVIDEAGAAVPNQQVSFCGPACFYGETDASGQFVIDVSAALVSADYSVTAHARPSGASFYYPASLRGETPEGVTLDAGAIRTFEFSGEMPDIVVKNDLDGAAPPAQTVSAQGVELSVEAGVQIEIEIDEVAAGASGRRFYVKAFDAGQIAELAPEAGLFALYAIGPFEARFSEPGPPKVSREARLSFPNAPGLAPGSAVEVLALGSYLFPEWVYPGRFEVVAEASVSSDGQRIELLPGSGLPYLTWFGLRSKP